MICLAIKTYQVQRLRLFQRQLLIGKLKFLKNQLVIVKILILLQDKADLTVSYNYMIIYT